MRTGREPSIALFCLPFKNFSVEGALSTAETLRRCNRAIFKELNVILALPEGLPIGQTVGVGISGFGKVRPVRLDEIGKLDINGARADPLSAITF